MESGLRVSRLYSSNIEGAVSRRYSVHGRSFASLIRKCGSHSLCVFPTAHFGNNQTLVIGYYCGKIFPNEEASAVWVRSSFAIATMLAVRTLIVASLALCMLTTAAAATNVTAAHSAAPSAALSASCEQARMPAQASEQLSMHMSTQISTCMFAHMCANLSAHAGRGSSRALNRPLDRNDHEGHDEFGAL